MGGQAALPLVGYTPCTEDAACQLGSSPYDSGTMSIRESIAKAVKLVLKVHDADLKDQLQAALFDARGHALDLQERAARQ